MKHLPALALATVALLVAGCEPSGCQRARPDTRPNIVLIVLDSLRADHLGLYGYALPTSPRLDALGSRSLVVDQMIAQAPWTKPSVASMLTSLMPQDHGVVHENTDNVLGGELVTVAESLQAAGFRTACFSENPHIQPSLGFAQGFDDFVAAEKWAGDPQAMATMVTAWLEQHASERFFLYAHFLDPHAPYTPPEPIRSEVLAGRTTADPRIERAQVHELQQPDGRLTEPLSAMDLAYLTALYDGEIRAADAAVGALLDGIDDLGLAQHTIVVVTSDHGEEFLDHGLLEHGKQMYDESIRVPLILHVPGMTPRRDHASIVQHLDVAPTLLELASVQRPAQFRGRSMVPMLRGEHLDSLPAVSQTSWRMHRAAALRSREWKAIVDVTHDRRLLFHLPSDPEESHDVRPDNQALAEALEHELAARLAPVQGGNVNPVGTRNEHLEKALHGLGYLDRDR